MHISCRNHPYFRLSQCKDDKDGTRDINGNKLIALLILRAMFFIWQKEGLLIKCSLYYLQVDPPGHFLDVGHIPFKTIGATKIQHADRIAYYVLQYTTSIILARIQWQTSAKNPSTDPTWANRQTRFQHLLNSSANAGQNGSASIAVFVVHRDALFFLN